MKQALEAVISESGIWNGTQKDTHSFLLSPSVYEITQSQKQELSMLGNAIYDCLLGLSHMGVIAYDEKLNYAGVWRKIRQIFSTGVPKMYHQLQGINVKDIPRLLKVDLMVDDAGNFKIAEIDGHNKHGLGYSTLAMRFRKAVRGDANALPGAVALLSEEILRVQKNEIKLLYGHKERFYIPEFNIAAQEFKKYGILCHVKSEMDVESEFLKEGLFLDLPFMVDRPALYDTIVPSCKNGSVSFIIPPKPYLGAKSVLALLANSIQDEDIESVMKVFIPKKSLALVRTYIPQTFLVGKQAQNKESVLQLLSAKRYVLKRSISSGMKGTFFSDDQQFSWALTSAIDSNADWILQEEIQNVSKTFSWYEHSGECATLQTSSGWFMRVTVQYIARKLADIVVTGCKDKAVHGGKRCVQIGSIVVEG